MTITAIAGNFSGFGKTGCEIFSRLKERGIDCKFRYARLEETVGGRRSPYPQIIKDHFVDKVVGKELVHIPLLWNHVPAVEDSSVYTMYESTRIPKLYVDVLNMYKCVATPTKWNAEVFKESGVKVPIAVVPLGVDTTTYRPGSKPKNDVCVFGAGAYLGPSQRRKNFPALINAWVAAFRGIKDVRLHLKTMPNDPVPDFNDSRITLFKEFMQPYELAEWYRGLNAFISTSRCEGWNLMAHEAMACGVPVISHKRGAHETVLPEGGYFQCWAKIAQHNDNLEFGYDWEIDKDDLVDAMRLVYHDRKEAEMRGKIALHHARQMTWDETVLGLLEVVNA